MSQRGSGQLLTIDGLEIILAGQSPKYIGGMAGPREPNESMVRKSVVNGLCVQENVVFAVMELAT
jgi:hypothetical protein